MRWGQTPIPPKSGRGGGRPPRPLTTNRAHGHRASAIGAADVVAWLKAWRLWPRRRHPRQPFGFCPCARHESASRHENVPAFRRFHENTSWLYRTNQSVNRTVEQSTSWLYRTNQSVNKTVEQSTSWLHRANQSMNGSVEPNASRQASNKQQGLSTLTALPHVSFGNERHDCYLEVREMPRCVRLDTSSRQFVRSIELEEFWFFWGLLKTYPRLISYNA